MQLFFFASGYFYKSQNENQPWSYIVKKVKRLLIPCVIYNLFYGIFTMLLSHAGFGIGEKMSPYTVLVSPFVFGSDFKFNSPDWFIAQLFVVEVVNVLICSMCIQRTIKHRAQISCALYLILGMAAVVISQNFVLDTLTIILCRTLFSLSWYGLGRLYGMYQQHDCMKNSIYFAIVFCVQLLLLVLNNGNVQSSVVSFNFGHLNVISIYLSALMGIAFWVRMCKLIGPRLTKNKLIAYIGCHTFSIVENQYFGFFVLNLGLCMLDGFGPFTLNFDKVSFYTRHNYIWTLGGIDTLKILYVIVGICVPILLSFLGEKIAQRYKIGKEKYLLYNEGRK